MDKKKLCVVLGQLNPIVGNIEYNLSKIISIIESNQSADLIIFPEMALVGYPLMDHILDPLIREKNRKALERIKRLNSTPAIILGTFTEPPELYNKIQRFYNSAIVIEGSKIIHIENKRLLPNYDVFDERRYFSFDNKLQPVKIKGIPIGILICEDIWDQHYDMKVAKELVNNGAELLVVINASPYHISKFTKRKEILSSKSKKHNVPVIYVNMVGGLDEIVYDGQSFITNRFGQVIYKAVAFKEASPMTDLNLDPTKKAEASEYKIDWREEVIEALKLNLRDYYEKSGIFEGVVLGLSGGIDSAFTSYICTKALGPKKVTNIMMPTKFTSQESLNLARNLCENMGSNYIIHPIDQVFETFETSLQKELGDISFDVADENLQARIRANILMYYSNKYNWLLVSTGNKSEIAVGYCTLYGDTCGGKNIPGDLLKVQIYEICDWINRDKEIIPEGIISRPPTAELRENQKDSDSLPPYEILDQILQVIINHGIGNEEEYLDMNEIDISTLNKVRRLYLNAEFKRRQLVQSIKVSPSAFGIGRRYPVLKKINLSD
jgi:NAD+ synthase (glutamine-hydrolysing)